jgi:hypothetical protein
MNENELNRLKDIDKKIEQAYCLLEGILIDVSNIIVDIERTTNE